MMPKSLSTVSASDTHTYTAQSSRHSTDRHTHRHKHTCTHTHYTIKETLLGGHSLNAHAHTNRHTQTRRHSPDRQTDRHTQTHINDTIGGTLQMQTTQKQHITTTAFFQSLEGTTESQLKPIQVTDKDILLSLP